MSESAIKFRLVKKEKEPKFNIDNLEHYDLLLQVGFSDFQICVIDIRKNKILMIEDYIMLGVSNQFERVECLEVIFNDHHLLLAGFWHRVKVLVKNRKFAFLPSSFFLKDKLEDYLKINCKLDSGSESFFHYKSDIFNLVNVYAINSGVVDFLNKTYPTKEVEYFHQSGVFINGFNNYLQGSKKPTLFINLDRFSLHLTVIQKGILEYYNQFPIKEFNDYLRYIGMVINEFGLDTSRDRFFIWGYLGNKSDHFKQLQKKMPNLVFGRRPSNLKFGYIFDEIPEHQYFDLLSFNHLYK